MAKSILDPQIIRIGLENIGLFFLLSMAVVRLNCGHGPHAATQDGQDALSGKVCTDAPCAGQQLQGAHAGLQGGLMSTLCQEIQAQYARFADSAVPHCWE